MSTSATLTGSASVAPAAPSEGAPTAARKRILWLDVAKGIGILIVILSHATGGLADSTVGPGLVGIHWVFSYITLFIIPFFFLLTGVLVQRRIAKDSRGFVKDVFITILWPYFLWSTVQLSMLALAGSAANKPVGDFLPLIARLPVASVAQFYFLYILFFMHLTAIVLVPRIGALAFLVIACAMKLAHPYLPMTLTFHVLFVNFPFYALGVWAQVAGVETLLGRLGPVARIGIVIGGLAALAVGTAGVMASEGERFASLTSGQMTAITWAPDKTHYALIGMLAFLILSDSARGWLARVLIFIGQRSMAIFVVHVMFIAGLRIVLMKLHVRDPMVLLAACCAIGLIGPLILSEIARRLGVSRLVGMG